jgi:hypothetical protein
VGRFNVNCRACRSEDVGARVEIGLHRARLLDRALGRDAARGAFRSRGHLCGASLLGRGRFDDLVVLLGKCSLARQVREELDGGHLEGGFVHDLFQDLLCDLLHLFNGLVLAQVEIKLPKDLDWRLEVFALNGSNSFSRRVLCPTGSNLAGIVVETRLFRLLEEDVVRCARELCLDYVELAEDQVELSDLPQLLVVRRALVVLAAEQGPVRDIACAGLVATEMVGDDLA